jgi:predicted nucleotidyltransferase
MAARKIDLPIEEIILFCKRYQVKELAVFGSYLRDDFRVDSDIDFLVEFVPGAEIGFLTFTRMERELSAMLNHKVDLVPKAGLKTRIRAQVLHNSQVLYAA